MDCNTEGIIVVAKDANQVYIEILAIIKWNEIHESKHLVWFMLYPE